MADPDSMPTTRGLSFWASDPNLAFVCSSVMPPDHLERARPHLEALGELASGELDELAAQADRNPPQLRAWNARGERVDEIVKHPSYVAMERIAFERFGLHAMSHREGVLGWPGTVPHTVKAALSYLFAQTEFGLLCPVNVTDSTSRMLRHYASDELREAWLPGLTATAFDELVQGTQWMTERTGGSDVGASTTVARRDPDGTWRLWGDKWFCSNANADVALTLARPQGAPDGTRGLAMFLVPRRLADGSLNSWTINRLKDKLGSRSMATGEVTYAGALAYPVGDLERGFRQMMEMVNVSRLSNAVRSAGIMRRCVHESVAHARGRAAFGRPLAELPLLRRDLVEMLLDAEAATSVVLNAAAVLDRWDAGDAASRPLFRILTPLAKHWICERARHVASAAMNVRGGNGYVEEWVNPRLLRDAYLGSIWEGSTNVVALDVQRAIVREGCHEALLRFCEERLAAVTDAGAKPWVVGVGERADALRARIAAWQGRRTEEVELDARGVGAELYHVLAGSLLLSEGQRLVDAGDGYRKMLAAALYLTRWSAHGEVGLPWDAVASLDALIDWTPVGAEEVPPS